MNLNLKANEWFPDPTDHQLDTVLPQCFDPFTPELLQTADPQPRLQIHISRLPTSVDPQPQLRPRSQSIHKNQINT